MELREVQPDLVGGDRPADRRQVARRHEALGVLAARLLQVRVAAGERLVVEVAHHAHVPGAVHRLVEEGGVGLLSLQQELDGLAGAAVGDLAEEHLVDALGPQFGRDVRRQVRDNVAGGVDEGARERRAGRVDGHRTAAAQQDGLEERRIGAAQPVGLALHARVGGPVHGAGVDGREELADQRSYHLEVADLLCADVEQEIPRGGVLRAEALHEILQAGLEFAVRPAELLKERGGVAGVRLVDLNGNDEGLVVMKHGKPPRG